MKHVFCKIPLGNSSNLLELLVIYEYIATSNFTFWFTQILRGIMIHRIGSWELFLQLLVSIFLLFNLQSSGDVVWKR